MENEKLKVVHIITKLELGGAQINTVYTYDHLDRNRFEPYLISGPGGIMNEKVNDKDHFIILDNLTRPIHPIKDLLTYFKLIRILKKIKPHIVHTHSSKAGIIGRLAARRAKVPAIIHSVHGFSFSPFQSFLKRTFFTTAERCASRATHHFIFVSREDIETARVHGLIRQDYSLIRSGFPIRDFIQISPQTSELRKKYNIRDDQFVCGIIAPFKPQKGLFHLAEIAHRVLNSPKRKKDIVFFIAGDGQLREEFENELKTKGIFENFRLPGFIFDMPSVIDLFDLGVSTALWEGLPQSLVQLRLKKKAVVASDITGNREVISNGNNGYLVDVFDYDRFAQAVLELVHDDSNRVKMAAYNDDFSQWDADYMVKRQEELYRKLLD